MSATLIIEQQFRGPPDSGNGGYVSGVFAAQLTACSTGPGIQSAVQVTLRAPIPLDQSMQVVNLSPHQAQIVQDDLLIAEVEDSDLDLSVPTPPPYDLAMAARDKSASLQTGLNPFVPGGLGFHPICFCCGADVAADKGLRVFAAPVDGFEGVAAAWRPDTAFTGEAGMLPPAIIWAALDCPGQFAYLAAGIRTGMLGRMTAQLLKPVSAADKMVITGWQISVEGKKHFAGTALFNENGDCCAISKQVWIGRRD